MAVKIRLARAGTKKRPFFRLVAADIRSPRDGRFLDLLGSYDPRKDPPEIKLKEEKIAEWLKRGAQLTDTANQLLKKAGYGVKGDESPA